MLGLYFIVEMTCVCSIYKCLVSILLLKCFSGEVHGDVPFEVCHAIRYN